MSVGSISSSNISNTGVSPAEAGAASKTENTGNPAGIENHRSLPQMSTQDFVALQGGFQEMRSSSGISALGEAQGGGLDLEKLLELMVMMMIMKMMQEMMQDMSSGAGMPSG